MLQAETLKIDPWQQKAPKRMRETGPVGYIFKVIAKCSFLVLFARFIENSVLVSA